jgi:hypothetical protein
MNWLDDYQNDLVALQEAKADVFPVDLTNDDQVKKFLDDFKTIFGPLEDGRLDPGDINIIFKRWWEKFRKFELAAAKMEVAIQNRLAPLYQKLEQSSEEEWEEYAKMLIRVRLQSRPMQFVMQSIVKSNTAFSEAQASIEKLNKLLGE